MNWAVDKPVLVGPYAFAAIIETRVSVRSAGHTLAGDGEKRPVLFLLIRDSVAKGIDIKGQAFEADEIEVLYPRAIEQMKAMMIETE